MPRRISISHSTLLISEFSDFPPRGAKRQVCEFGLGDPAGARRAAGHGARFIAVERDAVAGDAVLDRFDQRAGPAGDAGLGADFGDDFVAGEERAFVFEGETREIPQAGPALVLSALAHQYAAVFADDDGSFADVGVGLLGFGNRDFVLQPGGVRAADSCEWTLVATRIRGRADQRAELHQGLVEAGDVFRGQYVFCCLPEHTLAGGFERIVAVCNEPTQETDRVRFEDWRALVEGDRCDGAGSVAADSRE